LFLPRIQNVLLALAFVAVLGSICAEGKTPPSSPPEASSSVLRLQRMYLKLPPHDTALYDALGVSPNATARELTQAYRRLSREHHPDKSSSSSGSGSSSEYEQVRNAYEVLKDDTTRLVYHQYGAVDTSEAVRILTGRAQASGTSDGNRTDPGAFSNDELLRLMGYPAEAEAVETHRGTPGTAFVSRQERVARIASQLLEQLRVVIEGQVSVQTLLDSVMQTCDVVKRQPMGAQILRCVGRAYRHSGQKSLALIANEIGIGTTLPSIGWASELVREGFRDAKNLATAAVASGRALAAEKRLDKHVRRYQEIRRQTISYHFDGEIGELTPTSVLAASGESDNDDDNDDDTPVSDLDDPVFDSVNQNDIEMEQLIRAQATILQSLQLEALWKVTKVEIDRVVREACALVLSGEYFFVPPTLEGWIGARSHRAVDATQGRRRAAELLVQVGNIMVEQSKDGTSWLQ
jgi:DnaJ domain/X-domain of DnaJ-containing